MKRARCDLDNSEDIVPSASKRQKTKHPIEDLILVAPTALEVQKTSLELVPFTPKTPETESSTSNIIPYTPKMLMMESAPVLTTFPIPSNSPIRSHPPSPLRYQISETPPAIQIRNTPPSTPTQHKRRGRLDDPLLKQVFRPVIQPLPEFKYGENEIEVVSIITTGAHSMIFRVFAGEKFYALKIHRYERNASQGDTATYPRPNSYFTSESNAYTNLTSRPSLHGINTPKCHGFINLTQIPIPPQVVSIDCPLRERFISKDGARALYRDYIDASDPTRPSMSCPSWRSYFKNAPAGSVILRGLVFSDLPLLSYINPHALSDPRKELRAVAMEGTKALKALHACGVLHGNIEGIASVLLSGEEGKGSRKSGGGGKEQIKKKGMPGIVFMGFDHAKTTRDFRPRTFKRMARREIKAWENRWACMKVKEKGDRNGKGGEKCKAKGGRAASMNASAPLGAQGEPAAAS